MDCSDRRHRLGSFALSTISHVLYDVRYEDTKWVALSCLICKKELFVECGPAVDCRECMNSFVDNTVTIRLEGEVFVS